MRITNNTMNSTFLNNLNKNMRRMLKAQEQATTGKSVSRPSDNPMLVGKILTMRENIAQNEQYNRNISDTVGWVQTQDTALNDVTATMNRIRDLIVKGATGSHSDTDRNAIKNEVEAKVGELKEVLNTNFDGRYIFGGQVTTKPPFEEKEDFWKEAEGTTPAVSYTPPKFTLTYNGDNNNLEREISQGVTIEIMTDGSQITNINKTAANSEVESIGDFLNQVIEALDDHEYDEDTGQRVKKDPERITEDLKNLSNDFLGKADEFIDNILRVRSKVGATHNRLESSEERNTEENTNLKGVLSGKEDVDFAESYMEYIMMTTAYQASLSMGAKILQPSLMDYLR